MNVPFAGTFVPLSDYMANDTRVSSVIVELRHDTYLNEEHAITRIFGLFATLLNAVEGLDTAD